MPVAKQTVEHVESLEKYKHGFVTDIDQEFAPKGLNEDIVRFISAKKGEPEWMLEWRLEAFRRWLALEEPSWAKVSFPRIDYQDSYYYAAPKQKITPASASSFLKVVTTETLSNTASTAYLGAPSTPASTSCSRIGMPSLA